MARGKAMVRSLVQFSKRLVVRVVAIAAVLGVAQYVLSANSRKQHVLLREKVVDMKKKSDELASKNEQLRLQIQAIQHDERYLEQVARQELGMVRADEVVYTFIN
jgi:cell division protein FtsB